MQDIWEGKKNKIARAQYEKQLYEEANRKINSFKPYREIIREVIEMDNQKAKRQLGVNNKIFREEIKRTMSGKELWSPPPKGFKGGKLNWVHTKLKEEFQKKMQDKLQELSHAQKKENYK